MERHFTCTVYTKRFDDSQEEINITIPAKNFQMTIFSKYDHANNMYS